MAYAAGLEALAYSRVVQAADRTGDFLFPRTLSLQEVTADVHEFLRYEIDRAAEQYWTRLPVLAPIERDDISYRKLDVAASHAPVDYPVYIAGPRQHVEGAWWVGLQRESLMRDRWNINFQHPSLGFFSGLWTVAHITGNGRFDRIGLSGKPNHIQDQFGDIQTVLSDRSEQFAILFLAMTGFTYEPSTDTDVPLSGFFVTNRAHIRIDKST